MSKKYASDVAGALNLYFCHRHMKIAYERWKEGGRNVQGHMRHVLFRLKREIDAIDKSLGPKWREKLRRGKHS